MPFGAEIAIVVWVVIGTLFWFYVVMKSGQLTVGDLMLLIVCALLGPVIICKMLWHDKTVLWKRRP